MLIAALVCAALYGLIVIGLYVGQRKILFRCDAAEVDPATLELKAKVVRLKTEDGGEPARVEHPALSRTAVDSLFSRQRGRHRPARRALSRHRQGGHGADRDRISRLRQLHRLAQRARAQARWRSGLCGGDCERRRAGAHRALGRVAWVWGRGRARRASQGWRARARTRPIRRSPTSRRPRTGLFRFAPCSAIRSATTC